MWAKAESVVDVLKGDLSEGKLKDMFASSNQEDFARNLLIKHIETEVKKRKRIVMPSDDAIKNSLQAILEELENSSTAQLNY